MLAVVISAFFALVSAQGPFEYPSFDKATHSSVFRRWRKHFGRKYKNVAEEGHRFAVFLENWSYYHSINEQNLGYTLGLNQFSDMNSVEFKRYIHGDNGSCLKKSGHSGFKVNPKAPKVSVPDSVDWTAKGKVTPVKNQGQCGSCWAFSTTGSIESRVAIATGKLVSLSEQELVDCSKAEGNQGCQGGLMDDAFKYVKKNGGLCSETAYPYKAANGACKSKTCGAKLNPISSYVDVTHNSASSLEAAVAAGPVSIAIEADQRSFQGYKGGVLSGVCGKRLDHGVLVVGYGTDSGSKFWKVKNSWGASWGEAGYIRMCRDCNKDAGAGECGLLSEPSYPVSA